MDCKTATLNLRINEKLKKDFKIYAIQQGKTMTEALEELMVQAMKEESSN